MQLASSLLNSETLSDAQRLKKLAWLAKMDLKFRFEGEKTSISSAKHFGPLRIQRPFYPEGKKLCHVILLHPPGGIAGGDILDINVEVGEDAQAQITTPGATKWYQCQSSSYSSQQVFLHVQRGAQLEWMPQDNILFNGAFINNKQSVHLEKDSSFLLFDFVDLGSIGQERSFAKGRFKSSLDIFLEGDALFGEKTLFYGDSPDRNSISNLQGFSCFGLLVSVGNTPIDKTILEKIKQLSTSEEYGGVSRLSDFSLIARWMGNSPEDGKSWFYKLWQIIRPWYSGREAVRPRIWAT